MTHPAPDPSARTRWDVIVVGGRVAGAATAMLLARGGLRVLCLDRPRQGRPAVPTRALMRGGVLQLHRWGVLDDVIAAGTPPVRRTVFHYGDEAVTVSVRPSAGVDALYAPRAILLEALLVDAAARAGAEVDFGAPVIGLHRRDDGRVAGVVTAGRQGAAERTVCAPLVIGADGRESLVAREVGASPVAVGQHPGAFLYGHWANLPTDGYEWFYRQGITAGAIPTNDGLTSLFIGTSPERLDALVGAGSVRAAFDLLAGEAGLAARIADAAPVEPVRQVGGLPAGYLRNASGPGWALVGDAGLWMDPVSTHGRTATLRDATLLARAVVEAARRGTSLETSLERYQIVRNRLSRPMLHATEEIASYAWDLARIPAVLRSLASAMTDEVETLAGLTPDENF